MEIFARHVDELAAATFNLDIVVCIRPVPAMQTQPSLAPSPTASSAGRQQTLTLPPAAASPIVDTALTRRTSEHLHRKHLPYVDAKFFAATAAKPTRTAAHGTSTYGLWKTRRRAQSAYFSLASPPLEIKNQISVVGEIPEHPKASASQNEMDLEPAPPRLLTRHQCAG